MYKEITVQTHFGRQGPITVYTAHGVASHLLDDLGKASLDMDWESGGRPTINGSDVSWTKRGFPSDEDVTAIEVLIEGLDALWRVSHPGQEEVTNGQE